MANGHGLNLTKYFEKILQPYQYAKFIVFQTIDALTIDLEAAYLSVKPI